MDPPAGQVNKDNKDDWTRLFVESAQAALQHREEHTADARQAVQQYTAAAEQKIKDALGQTTLLSGCGGTSLSLPIALRPRTKAR